MASLQCWLVECTAETGVFRARCPCACVLVEGKLISPVHMLFYFTRAGPWPYRDESSGSSCYYIHQLNAFRAGKKTERNQGNKTQRFLCYSLPRSAFFSVSKPTPWLTTQRPTQRPTQTLRFPPRPRSPPPCTSSSPGETTSATSPATRRSSRRWRLPTSPRSPRASRCAGAAKDAPFLSSSSTLLLLRLPAAQYSSREFCYRWGLEENYGESCRPLCLRFQRVPLLNYGGCFTQPLRARKHSSKQPLPIQTAWPCCGLVSRLCSLGDSLTPTFQRAKGARHV